MMAGNRIGDQFGHPFVLAVQAKLQHLLRTGGRMIDTTRSTRGDIILVGFRVFPEVMEPTASAAAFAAPNLLPNILARSAVCWR